MKIKVLLRRYIPDLDINGFKEYEVELEKGMTVLDVLLYIKENIDQSLSFRYSCRMGICGSCGMFINGKPELACHTQVEEVLEGNILKVEPMPNLPVIKDLVCDMRRVFANYRNIKPYVIRKNEEEQENPHSEYKQTPEELMEFLQFSYCIQCGLCITSCPVSGTDNEFYQPFVLAQAYRFCVDSRDEGTLERVKSIAKEDGVFNCHFAGGCSFACPKGVDPALAIQLLKRLVLKASVGLLKDKEGAKEYGRYPESPDKDKIPKPPPKTV